MQEWVTPAVLAQVAQICRDAGAIIMPYFDAEGMAFDNKDDARKSQVTEADTAAEDMILPALRALAPHVPIVAEEAAAAGDIPDVSGGEFWLVDPLDGTKEFIKKIPEFTVNIGLIRNGKPVLGVVYSPASNHLYAGSTILGTAYKEIDTAPQEPISVRKIDPAAITICLSRTYGGSVELTTFLERFTVKKQVDAGSSIKFCLLARGEADVYPRYGGSCRIECRRWPGMRNQRWSGAGLWQASVPQPILCRLGRGRDQRCLSLLHQLKPGWLMPPNCCGRAA